MSRRLWIVWLVLALLPLRSWAVASMAMSAAPVGVASEAALSDDGPALPPCHQAAANSSDSDRNSAVNACTLCDLCHCAASVAPAVALPAAPVPDGLPRPAAAHDTGRNAVGGLERPPRFFFA